MFCNNASAVDSIEHFIHCPAVHDLYPMRWKAGQPPRVPAAHFFLFRLDNKSRVAFALMNYATYAVHNSFRHSNVHTDFKLCVYRMLGDIPFKLEVKKALWETLGPF